MPRGGKSIDHGSGPFLDLETVNRWGWRPGKPMIGKFDLKKAKFRIICPFPGPKAISQRLYIHPHYSREYWKDPWSLIVTSTLFNNSCLVILPRISWDNSGRSVRVRM